MPIVPREDGLYDVHSYETGELVAEGVPPELVDQELIQDPYEKTQYPVTPQGSGIEDPYAQDPSAGLPEGATAGPPMPGQLTVQPPEQAQVFRLPPPGAQLPPDPGGISASGAAAQPPSMYGPESASGQPGGPGALAPFTAGGAGQSLSPEARGYAGDVASQMARGSRGSYQKPGFQPRSTVIEQPAPLPEEQQQEYSEAIARMAAAGEQEAQASAQKFMGQSAAQLHQAALANEKRMAAEQALANQQKRQAEEDRIINGRMSRLQGKVDELRDKKAHFDPEKYWNDKGAFGTFLARVGIALGAIGSAITGGPNQVQQMVEAEIDRNVQGQKDQIEMFGEDITQEFNLLGEMKAQFQDQDAAELATRQLMAEAMAAQIEEVGAAAGSLEAQQNAKIVSAQLRQKYEMDRLKLMDLERGTIQRTNVYRPGGTVGGRPADPMGALKFGEAAGLSKQQSLEAAATGRVPEAAGTGEDFLEQHEYRRKALEFGLERQVHLPSGRFAYAATAKDAETAKGVVRNSRELKQNYGRMLEIIEEGTPGNPFGGAQAEYQALAARNAIVWKGPAMDQLGVLAGPDMRILDSYSGAGAENLRSLDSKTKMKIKVGLRSIDQKTEGIMHDLYEDPYARKPLITAPIRKPAYTDELE